jgi:hypothetical protein
VSTFDPMAAVIDWLDAYRAGSLSIVDSYTSDAVLECRCSGMEAVRGRDAITNYWARRFAERPAGELVDLQPIKNAIVVSYRVPDGLVQATLYFDGSGRIARSVCGPI